MSCQHQQDNQGFCHKCGKPQPWGLDAYIAYLGDFSSEGVTRATKEWAEKVAEWERKHAKEV